MTVKKDSSRDTWFFVIDPASDRREASADAPARVPDEEGSRSRGGRECATASVAATFVRPARVTVRALPALDEWLPAKTAKLKPSTAAKLWPDDPVVRGSPARRCAARRGRRGDVERHVQRSACERAAPAPRVGLAGSQPKTVRNVHGMLHRAFADAVRWRRLAMNPAGSADQPAKPRTEMRAWDAEQLRTFTTATADDRLGAVWRLFALTGMRPRRG